MFWIRGRRLWGARKPKAVPTREDWSHGVDVVLHYSADAGPRTDTVRDERRYLQGIQTFHQQVRGWNDVGYNYAVMRSGRVYELRGFDVVGAHVLNQNHGKVGILLPGNGADPTAKQVAAYHQLRRRLVAKGAKLKRTVGHGDLMPTQCPGKGIRRTLLA